MTMRKECAYLLLLPLMVVTGGLDAYCCGRLYNLRESPYTTFIAQKPGDILTIIVEETGSTTNNGNSTSERTNSQTFALEKFFFPHFKINRGLDDANGTGDPLGFTWNSSNEFSGKGSNDSEHKIETKMQARIIEAIDEEHFLIKGHRTLNIDGKEKKLFVSGTIRQRDIAPDNTISSNKIADAHIEIEGDLSHQVLEPGLLNKIINFLL